MFTLSSGLYGLVREEISLIALGPNREPTLYDAHVSKGIPTTAKSTSSVVLIYSILINVFIPENLGDSCESAALYLIISIILS